MAVRRGIPVMHMHLGNVVLDTEPDKALAEFRLALQIQEALPEEQRKKLNQVRLHATLLRKTGQAFSEMGMYKEAQAAFSEARPVFQRLSDADLKDVNALADLWRVLEAEAMSDEEAGNGDLSSIGLAEQRRYRLAAMAALEQEANIVRESIQLSPSHEQWDQVMASVTIRIGALKRQLSLPPDSPAATERSLKLLLQAAENSRGTASDIAAAVDAELNAEPTSVRNPGIALRLAKRGVDLTHNREATYLLLLARAYRATGDTDHAAQSATQGLALLAPVKRGIAVSRLHVLLTQQLNQPKAHS
jgi:tetratricopeptide (TPR) repeat protein